MTDSIVGKFAKVNNPNYKEYGLEDGCTVLIVGSGFAPLDEEDRYQLLFVVSKLEGDKLKDHGVTMKRSSLTVVSEEEGKKLYDLIKDQVNDKEATETKTVH